jgi:putative glutamine amidotransferase
MSAPSSEVLPVVGVCAARERARWSFWDRPAHLVSNSYVRAVQGAGGAAVLLPVDERAVERVIALIDGLLLIGGADVDPRTYGTEPGPATETTYAERDRFEIAMVNLALERNLPVLGICRGFQAVNVFSGGRLVQHLERHQDPERPREPVIHPLRLHPGSRLARILRPTDPVSAVLRVNSFHHQGVRPEDVAPGLVVAGTSPGPKGELVEALESASSEGFVVGVQCHPERTESSPPEFERLWSVFVDACRGSALGTRVG